MPQKTANNYTAKIEALENRLAEAEALIEAIKAGQVDAFAFNKNNRHEIFTLQSGDFAYRVLVENINEGAINLSYNKLIVYTNKSFCTLLGLPYEKVIGRCITDFIIPECKVIFDNLFTEAVQNESKGEVTMQAGDKIIPVLVSITSLAPNLPSVGVIITDLTEKKQAQKESETRQTLQNIFKQTPAAIMVTNGPEFTFSSANTLYLKMVNRTEEDLLGKTLADVFPETKEQGVIELYEKVYTTGQPVEVVEKEVTLDKGKDGTRVSNFYNSVMQPIKDENGNIISIMTLVVDVTKEVQAKIKLEESGLQNARLAAIIQSSQDAVIGKTTEGIITSWNAGAEKIFGYTDEEMIGQPLTKIIPADRQEEESEILYKIKQGKTIKHFETKRVNKQGRLLDISITVSPIKDSSGKIVGASKIARDITLQKENERRIKENEKELQQLIMQAPVAIVLLQGEALNIKVVNENALLLMGRKYEDVINHTMTSLLPDLPERVEIYNQVYKTGIVYKATEVKLTIIKNGVPYTGYYDINCSPWFNWEGNIKGVVSISAEVTQKVEAKKLIEQSEKELQQLKEQLELSIEAGNIGVWYLDVKNDVLKWNESQAHIYGLTSADGIKSPADFHKFIVKEDYDNLMQMDLATQKNPNMHYSFRIKRADDEQLRWIYSRSKNIYNTAGELQFITGINIDVTEQKLSEEILQQSQQELDELANAVPQLVWMADSDGNVVYYNRRINEFTCEARNEDGNWLWDKLLHPDDLEATNIAWTNALQNKTPYEKEHRLLLANGEYRWFLSRGYPQISKDGVVIQWYGTATNIHQQKLHETQKDDFLKMVSHELKTPVTSVKGYVELLLMMLENDQSAVRAMVQQPLKRIDYQVDRLGKLIAELLDISRLEDGRLDLNKENFRLDELVKETVQDVLFANSTHKIIITQSFKCTVYADKSRINQALINLINNAVKYSPQQNLVEVNITHAAGNFVAAGIKDYGVGIENSEQEKIFQRFYQAGTPKTQNYTGFGIGLYLTAEIIKRHGGTINVQSKKNEGSLFTFTLPLAN
jgi:PAS domain S-box-containing protein